MTTENWQQFKDVFQAALELPVGQRAAYLEQVCTEPAMRAELESLLFCYQAEPHSARKTAPDDRAVAIAGEPPAEPLIETFVDRYQIIGEIGKLESIEIYRAVRIDGAQLKPVVLSLLKRSSRINVPHDFSKQRIVLTGIRHANLAEFLDLGLTDKGLIYWVDEYVDGIPIDQYCDLNHLPTVARIKIFLAACQGVQYGHEHFVGHGSITSDRILVESNGNPKVVNLGITDLNAQWGLAPEPANLAAMEYMSPERARGARITSTDDVFSLGVLLYRLLTGHSPFRINDEGKDDLLPAMFGPMKPSQVLSRVVETENGGGKIRVTPETASAARGEEIGKIRRQLAGDLDCILLKAVQKETLNRYSSVEQFCVDLRRYLEGRPVSCRANTLPYRARKFCQRHPSLAVIGGLLVALATLILGRQLGLLH